MTFLRRLEKLANSSSLMMAASNFARAGSLLAPVVAMHLVGQPADSAFWLAAATVLSFQFLLFLGFPQIVIRTIAVHSLDGRALNGDIEDRGATTPAISALSATSQALKLVFQIASPAWVLALAILGSLVLAAPIRQMSTPAIGWFTWAVFVLGSPVRVGLLRQLTFLNGLGDVTWPRRLDAVAWSIAGVASAAVFLVTKSMVATVIVFHIPVALGALLIERRCVALGWRALTTPPDRKVAAAALADLWPPTWRSGLGVFLSAGARQGVGLIFAQYAAPRDTAAFLLAQNAISVLLMMSSAPVQARIHDMTRSWASGDNLAQIRTSGRALTQSLWVVALICGPVGLGLAAAAAFSINVSFFVSAPVWTIMSLGLLFQRYGAAHLQHYSIKNHIISHWLDGLTGIVNLAVSMWLMTKWGMMGLAIGGLVSSALVYAWIPSLYAHRAFNLQWPRYDLRACGLPVLTFLIFALAAGALPENGIGAHPSATFGKSSNKEH